MYAQLDFHMCQSSYSMLILKPPCVSVKVPTDLQCLILALTIWSCPKMAAKYCRFLTFGQLLRTMECAMLMACLIQFMLHAKETKTPNFFCSLCCCLLVDLSLLTQ